MTEGAFFWFVVCAASAAIFFGIAIVVTVRGVGELRDLLGRAERQREVKR